jgi:hypothetical protein
VTLIELMIALAISMLMMSAVIMLFANIVGSLVDGRALIEVSERLRTVRNRLQLDLAGHTATTIPPLRPEDGQGYLEIIEGPNTDNSGTVVITPTLKVGYAGVYHLGKSGQEPYTNSIMGDADDMLMLTVRSQGEPFVGNMAGTMIESNTAEVVWFAVPNGRTLPSDPSLPSVANGGSIQLYTLYRRVLLVNPTYFNTAFPAGSSKPPATLQEAYDLSLCPVYAPPVTTVPPSIPAVLGSLPNTLSTLTSRENRYYHQATTLASAVNTGFPFPVVNTTSAGLSQSIFDVANRMRIGEDVMLTDVLSFDIRVFDPLAALRLASDGTALVPSDPGYGTQTTVGYGAFVDPGYGKYSMSGSTFFSANPNATANSTGTAHPSNNLINAAVFLGATYDTWSWGYEQNGVDEDGDDVTDQGTDGLDDEPLAQPDGIIDDPPQVSVNLAAHTATILSVGERETLAPYPFPLRGVQIRIRVYEPDTRQVREVKIVQDFLPD